jgi:hypothetical protein
MKWFRMWTDILDDPKCSPSRMSRETFSTLILLFAYASELETGGKITSVLDTAWRLRMHINNLKSQLHLLEKAGIITLQNNGITIINWDKRQFLSDDSYARVKRFRNEKRNVSETKKETAPEQIQNRAEQSRAEKPIAEIFFKGQVLKIPTLNHEAFLKSFPGVNLEAQYRKMDSWMLANPGNKKKNHPRFAQNWLSNSKPENGGAGNAESERQPNPFLDDPQPR